VDAETGRGLLLDICRLARTAGGELADAGEAIESHVSSGTVTSDALLAAVIDSADTRLTRYAKELGVDRVLLSTLCYHAIRPSLVAWSRKLAVDPGASTDWDQGICPICGSPPAMALLGAEGRRILVCGFCWHQWPDRRSRCPFCRTSDHSKLRYFFDESEPECRVDLCDNCRRYLKTIDTRKTDRAVYPPLEALTTLHLDMSAQDMGFSKA
jgi:FdhE protein